MSPQFALFCVHSHPSQPITAEVSINGKHLSLEADTGFAVSAVPKTTLNTSAWLKTLFQSYAHIQINSYAEVLGKIEVMVTH